MGWDSIRFINCEAFILNTLPFIVLIVTQNIALLSQHIQSYLSYTIKYDQTKLDYMEYI